MKTVERRTLCLCAESQPLFEEICVPGPFKNIFFFRLRPRVPGWWCYCVTHLKWSMLQYVFKKIHMVQYVGVFTVCV